MTLKVSVSSLDTYESCPRKYKFQQIDKLPRKSFEHLDVGNYVHEVLEKFHKELSADAAQQPEELLKRLAKELWAKYALKISVEGQEKSKGLLKSYLAYVSANGWPDVIATEDRFNIQISDELVIRGVVDRIDRVDGGYQILDYKGLALDTPIPTPDGWTTMGDLAVGDKIFGSDGRTTTVTLKSQIHNRPCYKIIFSDDSQITCDNVHLWSVSFDGLSIKDEGERTLSADQIFNQFCAFKQEGAGTILIKNAKPLHFEEQSLPIAPWALGAWLSDRCSGQAGTIANEAKDSDVLSSKCIPDLYMRTSVSQRLELLRGIMDSSGTFDDGCGCCIFTSHDRSFADSVRQLIRTLGVSTQMEGVVDAEGLESYEIKFSPVIFNPFKSGQFAEKVDGFNFKDTKSSLSRSIKSMEKVESVPTQCIQVDAPDSLYVCGSGYNLSHNTGQSKYLDKFQLQVYGMHLKNMYPDIEEYDGVYLVLPEGPKKLSYKITLKDIEEAKQDVIKTAEQISTDKTWAPKPTFLCKFCDYTEHCPDAWGKGSESDLVKISGRKKF